MNYKGPLYGKIGRRYIPLRQTSEDVDKMEKDAVDVEYLVRNWVNDSTQLDNASLREMVLYALREENDAKRKAMQEACDARDRTMRLLSTCLEYRPWENSPSLTAKIRADAKSLLMNPEGYCKIIAKELVEMMKAQAKHF